MTKPSARDSVEDAPMDMPWQVSTIFILSFDVHNHKACDRGGNFREHVL